MIFNVKNLVWGRAVIRGTWSLQKYIEPLKKFILQFEEIHVARRGAVGGWQGCYQRDIWSSSWASPPWQLVIMRPTAPSAHYSTSTKTIKCTHYTLQNFVRCSALKYGIALDCVENPTVCTEFYSTVLHSLTKFLRQFWWIFFLPNDHSWQFFGTIWIFTTHQHFSIWSS